MIRLISAVPISIDTPLSYGSSDFCVASYRVQVIVAPRRARRAGRLRATQTPNFVLFVTLLLSTPTINPLSVAARDALFHLFKLRANAAVVNSTGQFDRHAA